MAKNKPKTTIIIIALTGFDMEEDRDVCIQAGMNDYISKPINPEELIDTLEGYLSSLE
ncbi:MAG: response regulator [Deltaproteobacteria bacterium]|nr:response regulator [Deltaproteobacteria bacterium]